MGNEIELKFQVAPRELRKLKAARTLHLKPPKEEDLVSVYFDTPKHKLARNGVSLRVRRHGDKFLQTIKSGGSNSSFRTVSYTHLDVYKRQIKNGVVVASRVRKMAVPGTRGTWLALRWRKNSSGASANAVWRWRMASKP